MEIYTAEDLVKFRDRVNKGATYEGRTIKVMNDIDLSNVCGKNVGGKEVSWKPIGFKTLDSENAADDYIWFKGTFNGQYKHINNLYINTDQYDVAGLFCYNSGTIKNILMNNVYIYIDYSDSPHASDWDNYIGSLVGYNIGIIENIGINSGSITNINTIIPNIISRDNCVGGVVGTTWENSIIKGCYNKVKVKVETTYNNNTNYRSRHMVGGIVGDMSLGLLENCYNTIDITSKGGGNNLVGGIIGRVYSYGKVNIKNSYNYGAITSTNAGITNSSWGILGNNSAKSGNDIAKVENSYFTNISATYLDGDRNKVETGKVTEEELKGYASILNEKDEEGNEIEIWVEDTTGINNGYPILKWQVEH